MEFSAKLYIFIANNYRLIYAKKSPCLLFFFPFRCSRRNLALAFHAGFRARYVGGGKDGLQLAHPANFIG